MKYFKKISPQVRLQLSNGHNLQFENVDGEWGILAVGNPGILAELAVCIKQETGGVIEITEAEYNEMAEKKTTYRPRWRDEMSKSGSASQLPTALPRDLQSVAVSVEGHSFTPPPADRVTPTAQQAPQFRPSAIPRNP